jgi:hypothetical protein
LASGLSPFLAGMGFAELGNRKEYEASAVLSDPPEKSRVAFGP